MAVETADLNYVGVSLLDHGNMAGARSMFGASLQVMSDFEEAAMERSLAAAQATVAASRVEVEEILRNIDAEGEWDGDNLANVDPSTDSASSRLDNMDVDMEDDTARDQEHAQGTVEYPEAINTSQSPPQDQQMNTVNASRSPSPLSIAWFVPPVHRQAGTVAPHLASKEPFIYDQGLVFDPTLELHSETSVHFYSAVILFNAALTYHLEAHQEQDTEGRESLLLLAFQYYDYALVRYRRAVSACHWGNDLLLLALLNNKAEIYYELGEYDAAQHLWRGVMGIIHCQDIRPSCLELCELEGFLFNSLSFLNSPMHAPSA